MLVGFDFPIGLPRAFAVDRVVTDPLNLPPRLGHGAKAASCLVVGRPDEIASCRPSPPAAPGAPNYATRSPPVV